MVNFTSVSISICKNIKNMKINSNVIKLIIGFSIGV